MPTLGVFDIWQPLILDDYHLDKRNIGMKKIQRHSDGTLNDAFMQSCIDARRNRKRNKKSAAVDSVPENYDLIAEKALKMTKQDRINAIVKKYREQKPQLPAKDPGAGGFDPRSPGQVAFDPRSAGQPAPMNRWADEVSDSDDDVAGMVRPIVHDRRGVANVGAPNFDPRAAPMPARNDDRQIDSESSSEDGRVQNRTRRFEPSPTNSSDSSL